MTGVSRDTSSLHGPHRRRSAGAPERRPHVLVGLSTIMLLVPGPSDASGAAMTSTGVTSPAIHAMVATGTTASYCQKNQGCDYLESWPVQAVLLQNRLDVGVPIRLAVLPHSHNAFNAQKDGYHTDPNHVIGIQRQLEIGVRSLSFDIGAYPTGSAYQSTHSIRLCHKLCSDTDTFLGEGLRILRDYLRTEAGKDEVVFLQLELNMPPGNQGKYVDDIRQKLVDYLGDMIYRPPGGACTDWHAEVAQNVTKDEVRAAGKNVVINSAKGCYDDKLQSWLFDGTWKDSINLGSDQPGFSGYPSCEYGDKYDAAEIQAGFFRSFNDGTALGVVDTGSGSIESSSLTSEQMEKLRGCGVNALGPEPLDDWTDRWKAQVWSWAPNEPAPPFGVYGRPPAENQDDCAVHGDDARLRDAVCSTTRRFACQHPTTRQWKLTKTGGAWTQGAEICLLEFGKDGYVFSVPANGYENNELQAKKDKKSGSAYDSVWVDYSDRAREGDWQPMGHAPRAHEPAFETMLAGGGDWNGDYYPTEIAFGDVDGDGLDELGVTRYAGGGERWWIFDDAVHDFAELRSGGSDWNKDYYATAIAFGDVDHDGKDEVALGRMAHGGDRMWIYDDAVAGFDTLYEGGSGWNKDYYVTGLAFGDVDGDGEDELGVTREADDGARWFVLNRKSSGSFNTIHEGGNGWNSKNRATAIAFGNVDGDARYEVGLGRKADSGARWFVYDDHSADYATLEDGGNGWNAATYPTAIAFGNVDDDGRAELGITRNSSDNTRFWVLDDGPAGFATLAYGGSSWGSNNYATDIAFGDVDGDGQDELVVTREASSGGRYFLFDGKNGQYQLDATGGEDWNDQAYGTSVAFGKTLDAHVDLGLGRKAPDNTRYFVLGWN